ncbi:MAG TPA: deaminase, partial [bacterium]|nr:deaminase [bacterium]
MARALELAAKGRGLVSPNPMVGALLVKDGRVIGEGWHQKLGGPHAEVNAIEQAGDEAEQATLYVTLEPCC